MYIIFQCVLHTHTQNTRKIVWSCRKSVHTYHVCSFVGVMRSNYVDIHTSTFVICPMQRVENVYVLFFCLQSPFGFSLKVSSVGYVLLTKKCTKILLSSYFHADSTFRSKQSKCYKSE